VLADDSVDCAIIVLWAALAADALNTSDAFRRLKQQDSKPMAIWIYGPKLSAKEELTRQLEALGLPTYLNLETAAKALGIATKYAKFRSRLNQQRG
jgi:acyl-CoA synthetase (NDP forming)